MQMQSENIIEITGAIIKVQSELEFAKKDSSNPFFKSKYSDLATVWETCRDLLTKNNLAVIQQMDILEGKNVLITTLIHSSGQWFKSIAPLNPVKNDPQGFGSAITYMRRYSLSAILGIIQDDDDGEAACDRKKTIKYESKKLEIRKSDQDLSKMKKAFESYTQFFDECDQEMMLKYLFAYSERRDKTAEETLERFKDDKEFLESFHVWKSKQVPNETGA